ncbi:MAG: hypothetical protein V3T05_04645, partial [Myxococcota bacterium]
MDDSKPDEQPVVELVAEIFALTRDLLSRAWGIDGELGPHETDQEQLHLPELAVEIRISGDLTMRFILGVDQGVVDWGALQYVDAMAVTQEGCKDATRELAN